MKRKKSSLVGGNKLRNICNEKYRTISLAMKKVCKVPKGSGEIGNKLLCFGLPIQVGQVVKISYQPSGIQRRIFSDTKCNNSNKTVNNNDNFLKKACIIKGTVPRTLQTQRIL